MKMKPSYFSFSLINIPRFAHLLFALVFLLISLVIPLSSAGEHDVITQESHSITFAYVAPLSQAELPQANTYELGLTIAFNESNILSKLQFHLLAKDTLNNLTRSHEITTAASSSTFGFVGFWGADFLTSNLPYMPADMPIMAAGNGREAFRWARNPTAPRKYRILLAQPSFREEMAIIVEEIANDWSVLNDTAVLVPDATYGGAVSADASWAFLTHQSRPCAQVVYRQAAPSMSDEIHRTLSLIKSSCGPEGPKAVITALGANVAAPMIAEAVKVFGPETLFASISILDPDQFIPFLSAAGVPNSTTILIAQGFVSANLASTTFSTLLQDAIRRLPTSAPYLTSAWVIQGYTAGVMTIAAAMKAIEDGGWPLTRDSYWRAALALPPFDGLGPFCNTSTCACNQANHDMFLVSISPRVGSNTLRNSLHFQGCGVVGASSQTSLVVQHLFGSYGTTSRAYHKGLNSAIMQFNNAFTETISDDDPSISFLLVSQQVNAGLSTHFNNSLPAYLAPDPEALLSLLSSEEALDVPVFSLYTPRMVFRDPQRFANIIHIIASPNDEMYALNDFLISTLHVSNATVIYQSDPILSGTDYAQGLQLAAHFSSSPSQPTFSFSEFVPYSSVIPSSLLASIAAKNPGAVIVIANLSYVIPAVSELLKTTRDFPIILTTATLALQFSARLGALTSLPHRERVFQSLAFFPPTPPAHLLSNYDSSQNDHSGINVYFVGRFFTEVAKLALQAHPNTTRLTGTELLDYIYATNRFTVDDIQLGPFERGVCSQGRSVVSFLQFSNLTSQMASIGNKTLPSCGVVYPSSGSSNLALALILSILISVLVIGVLVCSLLFVLWYSKGKKVHILQKEKTELIEKAAALEAKLSAVPAHDLSKLLDTPAEVVVKTLAQLKGKNLLTDEDRTSLDTIMLLVAGNRLYQPNFVLKGGYWSSWVDPDVRHYLEGLLQTGESPLPEIARKVSLDLPPLVDSPDNASMSPFISTLTTWEFNPFVFGNANNGTSASQIPLLALATRDLVSHHRLHQSVQIDIGKLLKWLTLINNGYRSSNPYHNAMHALDVLQAEGWFLNQLSSLQLLSKFTDLEILAAIIACPIHDFSHPGVNSNFLINVGDMLAVRYNGISVLESMHVSESCMLLHQPALNFLEQLPHSKSLEFWQMLIKLVLATDMARHAELLGEFNAKLAGNRLNFDLPGDRIMLLSMLMKAADLSNASRPWDIARMWSEQVTSEFFLQGDQEKARGLPISPMMDRTSCNIPKMQQTFGDIIVRPLFEAIGKVIPGVAETILPTLQSNGVRWVAMYEQTQFPKSHGSK